MRNELTAARLREVLVYDQDTGVFTFRVTRGPMKAGDQAGYVRPDKRVSIHVDSYLYRAHRLAWLYMTGEWPVGEIDHLNANPTDNRWSNLRDVSGTVNKQNMRAAPASKKHSPLFGAHWCKQLGIWKSSIKVNGRAVHLGVFASDIEASNAYIDAKRRLHEGCTL